MNTKSLLHVLFALAVLTLLVGASASAQTTYYVDGVSGNDGWSGTASTFQSGNVGPKKTITAALALTIAGDVVDINTGTYNETVVLNQKVELTTQYPVTAGPVVIQNLTLNSGATATKLNVTGHGGTMTVSGTLLVQSGAYTVFGASDINVGAAGTLNIQAGSSTTFSATIGTTLNNYTLTFSNPAALTFTVTSWVNNGPLAVNFNGAGAVTLGATLAAGGNVTIASGASVLLGAFDLTIAGNFVNNGAYSGTGKANMTGTKTVSGTGTFQNLTFSTATTKTLASSLIFSNISQSTASLIDVAAGTLDFANFNITTPGSVTITGAVAYTGVTTGGQLIFTGDQTTIGTVTLTNNFGALNLRNLSINKPSGSTVNLAVGGITVTNQLNFTGGIFNIATFNLTLGAAHGATAAIGGNINGTTGTFSVGSAGLTNNLVVSGAGQINVPFVVDATPSTVTFTQLTTVGNSLTLTSGNLTTSSLQLINGTVTITAGVLTLNTTSVSITNTTTINGTSQLAGSSSLTISGALNQNGTSTINTTGSVTAASYAAVAGAGNVTVAALATSGAGNATFANSTYNIAGNLNVGGTLITGTGTAIVGGNTSSGLNTVLNGNLSTVNFTPTGALTFTAAGVLTVTGSLNGGSTVDFTTATSAAITGSFSSVGTTTIGAGNITVGANFTTTGATADLIGIGGNLTVSGSINIGRDIIGTAGTLTVTGTATVGRDLSVGAGNMDFQSTGGPHSVGRNLITNAVNAGTPGLRFRGPLTIAGNPGIQPAANAQAWRFDGSVTLTNATAKNIDLTTGAAAAFTIDFYGNVSANDLLMTGAFAQTVTFKEGTGLVSQLRNITVAVGGSAAASVIDVAATSTTGKQHNLQISGDITYGNIQTAINVGTRSKVVMNGSPANGDLQTFANSQTITTPINAAPYTIANLEIANTQTDSDPTTDGGGNGVTDETKESVNITLGAGSSFVVTNLTLTSNGLDATNLTMANAGTITRAGGSIGGIAAGPTIGAGLNLVYTNQTDITTSREYTIAAAANALVNLSLTGTGGKVTLTANSGTMTGGSLTVAAGRELAMSTFNVNVLTLAATGTYLTVNGTVSGSGILTFQPTSTNNYTIAGTTGSISNLTLNFAANGTVIMNSPVTLTGNLITSGATGTLTYGTAAPATIGGNLTLNNGTTTIGKSLAVTGNVTHTASATTLSGALTVGGNFSLAAGSVTLSNSGNVTITGNYTTTGGTIVLPATSTSSLFIAGTSNSINADAYTIAADASGRIVFNGTLAQSLILAGARSIDRLEVNNAAGLSISGAGATLTMLNLKLTNGSITHNGLMTMPGVASRIIRADGTLSSFLAAGPSEVEYVSTNSYTSGYEILNLMKKVIMNAASGNPTVTLDKNVTVTTGGELNLSRGTLAIGSFGLLTQNTNTVTRAEGFLTGTPTYGTGVTLQYFNTVGDLTTGPEFTNDGAVTTLNVNAPGKQVILGANVKVGGPVNLYFGTLNLNGMTFTLSAANTITNNGNITGTGTLANTGAGSTFIGTSTSWPNITTSGGLTINNTNTLAAGVTTTLASLSVTGGTTTFGAGITTTALSVTVTGNFAVSGTASTFTDAGADMFFQGNVSITQTTGGSAFNNTGTLRMVGTAAQTLSSTKTITNLAFNNGAGVTLGSNIIIASAGALTFTSGVVTTGTYYIQAGITGAPTITRTGGGVFGNMYAWQQTQPGVPPATTSSSFPMVTATGVYRPTTLLFTGTVAGTLPVIIRVAHTDAAPVGTVGLPLTTGLLTINKLSPMSWSVSMYDAATNLVLTTPATNPQVTIGVGGFAYGDITKIRSVYRLTNPANTWQVPGTFVGSYYASDGTATVIHSGVSGWNLEPAEIFTVGYGSTLAVANPIADQTLSVGGSAYTKTVQSAPAVFGGNVGTLTVQASSATPGVATAAVVGGVLTVTPVAAGSSLITLTGTDANGDVVTSTFTANVRGAISVATSTVSVGAPTVVAGSTTTITLQAKDGSGNNVIIGGATVLFTATGGTSTGTISAVTDNANGTYTATFTGVTSGTATTINATIGGVAVATTMPTITVGVAAISVVKSAVTVSNPIVYKGTTVNVTLQAKDAAGNNLAAGGAVVLFSNAGGTSTGTFSAVTDNNNGTYTAIFTGNVRGTATTVGATIGGVAVTSTMPTITVTNRAPTVTPATATVTVPARTAMTPITFTGADLDADAITWSVIWTIPTGAGTALAGTLTPSGNTATLTWTPDVGNVAQSNVAVVTATDALGATASSTVTITVTGIPRVPYFTTTAPTTTPMPAPMGSVATWNFAAADSDGLALTYSIAAGNVGAIIPATGVWSWTVPYAASATSYPTDAVSVTVTNSGGKTATQMLVLQRSFVNVKPSFTTAGKLLDQTVYAGTSFTFTYAATDPNEPSASTLRYSPVKTQLGYSTYPSWLSIDPVTGVLSGNASAASTAIYTIKTVVTDPQGLTDTTSAQLTVQVVTINVAGTVTYGYGTKPVSGAAVSLTPQGGGAALTVTTTATGTYQFTGIAAGTTYNVTVAKALGNHPTVNVNAGDALKAALYLPTSGASIPDTLGRLAADVTGDGFITAVDAQQIMLRYVGTLSSFAKGDWIFLPTAGTITTGITNMTNNIKAVAVGDANVDAVPTSGTFFAKTEAAPSDVIPSIGATMRINSVDAFEIPVRVKDAASIGSMSMAFQYPSQSATFLGVSGPDGMVSAANDGVVAVAWFNAEKALSMRENGAVVTLRFKPTTNVKDFTLSIDPSSQITDAKGVVLSGMNLVIPAVDASIPSVFAIGQNYPNPFNPSTTIQYDLPVAGHVTLTVYNMLGQVVDRLIDDQQNAGAYKIRWDASKVSSGVYMYQIAVDAGKQTFKEVRRMVLLK